MNWKDWYTDLMDIYRVQPVLDGSLTRHMRAKVHDGIPCRIYRSGRGPVRMEQTASHIRQEDKLACDISADVLAGDELHITRGARIGKPGPVIRAFAADPVAYYEPFGAIMPGLSHLEVELLQEERIKGGADNGGDAGGAGQGAQGGEGPDPGQA